MDGQLAGAREVPYTTPLFFELEGLSCGYDFGGAVLEAVYDAPFAFTGTIHEVVVDLSGNLIEDDESKLRVMMAHQ